MKKLSILIIVLMIGFTVRSQIFERQLGIRLGVTPGITGKVIKDNKTAIEGTLGFRKGGIQIYTLLETYKSLDKNTNQNWYMYFGGGAHIGYINGYNRIRRWSNTLGYYFDEERVAGPVLGLDAVMGVEYRMPVLPLKLFFEFKPLVELQSFNKVRANFFDTSIGLVYRFNN